MKKFLIEDEYVNSRLDRWFKRKVFNAPQSFIEKNIRKGHIRVNKKKIKAHIDYKKMILFILVI